MPQIVCVNLVRGAALGWGLLVFVGVALAGALAMTQRPQRVPKSQPSRPGVMAIGSWARALLIQTG